jgi:hypothetical protein
VIGAWPPTLTLTCPTLRPARPNANEPIPGEASVWSVTAPREILRGPQRSRVTEIDSSKSDPTRIPAQRLPGFGERT